VIALKLSENLVSDISALSIMINLRELWLGTNYISDISVLSDVINVQRLDLQNNYISDISSLVDLTNLTRLNLRDNFLNIAAYREHLPQIKSNNPSAEIIHDPNPYD